MIDDDITARLQKLTHAQLNQLKEMLDGKLKEKEDARRKAPKAPPRTSNDLNELAEMAGLDIRGLMREIGKRR